MKKLMIAAAAMAASVATPALAQNADAKPSITNIRFNLSDPKLALRILPPEKRPAENFRVEATSRAETPPHIKMISKPLFYRERGCLGAGAKFSDDGQSQVGVQAGKRILTPQ